MIGKMTIAEDETSAPKCSEEQDRRSGQQPDGGERILLSTPFAGQKPRCCNCSKKKHFLTPNFHYNNHFLNIFFFFSEGDSVN